MPQETKEVSLQKIGDTGAELYLIGTSTGTLGSVEESGTILVESIEVRVGEKRPIQFSLAQRVNLPGGLLTKEGTALRPGGDIENELKAAGTEKAAQFLALVKEAQRRLQSVEISAQAKGRFLGIKDPFGDKDAFVVDLRPNNPKP